MAFDVRWCVCVLHTYNITLNRAYINNADLPRHLRFGGARAFAHHICVTCVVRGLADLCVWCVCLWYWSRVSRLLRRRWLYKWPRTSGIIVAIPNQPIYKYNIRFRTRTRFAVSRRSCRHAITHTHKNRAISRICVLNSRWTDHRISRHFYAKDALSINVRISVLFLDFTIFVFPFFFILSWLYKYFIIQGSQGHIYLRNKYELNGHSHSNAGDYREINRKLVVLELPICCNDYRTTKNQWRSQRDIETCA